MIRLGFPNAQSSTGYIRFYNSYGQPLTVQGVPGSPTVTHIPINYPGPIVNWPR